MRRFRSSGRKCGVSLLAAVALGSLGLMAVTAWAQVVQTYTCDGGFQPVIAPPVPAALMSSLKTVPNPVIPKGPTGAPLIRADLADYVANLDAAIRLGKALFWDMQAGSDNKTACASCHFQAGADVRTKNQLNPGPSSVNLGGPNLELTATHFPISPTYDDIAGSQGVRASTFLSISKTGVESTTTPTGFRQVTGDHSPSAVNAVFNHRQFWNGRAQPDFNGVNPFGSRDSSVRVWVLDYRGNPVQVYINIRDASLASQAVGPPLNPVEMSAAGRTFPELGKKMLLAKPLGLQQVSATDGVLGFVADTTTGKGLTVSYKTLIQQAFQPKWWNSNKSVSVGGKSYTMMQANFSLYWGLALMLYQATLVSDDSPMDRYLATRLVNPNPLLLQPVVTRLALEGVTVTTDQILNGLDLFELPVAPPPSFPVPTNQQTQVPLAGLGCIACHLSAETTSASMRNLAGPGGIEPEHIAFKNAGFDPRMERMFSKLDWTPPGPLSPVPLGADEIEFDPGAYAVDVTSIAGNSVSPVPLPVATYDVGWYNLGVRPTADDPGLGGKDPFGKWLSWTKLFQALADPSFIDIPGGTLECPSLPGNPTFPNQVLNPSGFPLLSGPLTKTEPTDVAGSFKVPALRNVELNGPYFHNGGKSTLRQVVEFYDDGGDFTNPTKHPLIVPLQLTAQQVDDLVAFLLALTDERVLYQKAPFDHPELVVPNGEANGADITMTLPAVGAGGSTTPLPRFLNLNPFFALQ